MSFGISQGWRPIYGDSQNTCEVTRTYIPDEDVIIPNSKIPVPKGGLTSFPMTLEKFKDYLASCESTKNTGIVAERIEVRISHMLSRSNFATFRRYVRLDNGFCYAEFTISTKICPAAVMILYYNGTQITQFYPIMGNAINRLTNNAITGCPDDIFWLWEELNWGAPRPHGPIDLDMNEFRRIFISYDLIEKDIAGRVEMHDKEWFKKKPEEKKFTPQVVTPQPSFDASLQFPVLDTLDFSDDEYDY